MSDAEKLLVDVFSKAGFEWKSGTQICSQKVERLLKSQFGAIPRPSQRARFVADSKARLSEVLGELFMK